MLKNKSSTAITVPGGAPMPSRATSWPASMRSCVPVASARARVMARTRLTEAIAASASPRKPSDMICERSAAWRSLEVAWRANASSTSAAQIPAPSSETRIRLRPPPSTSTRMLCAPASRAFSSSSFTTEVGRSTTSPAAICEITASASTAIAMRRFYSAAHLCRRRRSGRYTPELIRNHPVAQPGPEI